MFSRLRSLAPLLLIATTLAGAAAYDPAQAADDPKKIVFVDTGNTGRSITAETMARIYAASHGLNEVFISRGVDADPFDTQVEMNAQILWQKRGIDLSAHRAAQLTAADVKHATYVLTLTAKHKQRVLDAYPEAKDKVFTIAEYATGANADIEDAWGKPIDAYERMFDALDKLVPAAADKAAK